MRESCAGSLLGRPSLIGSFPARVGRKRCMVFGDLGEVIFLEVEGVVEGFVVDGRISRGASYSLVETTRTALNPRQNAASRDTVAATRPTANVAGKSQVMNFDRVGRAVMMKSSSCLVQLLNLAPRPGSMAPGSKHLIEELPLSPNNPGVGELQLSGLGETSLELANTGLLCAEWAGSLLIDLRSGREQVVLGRQCLYLGHVQRLFGGDDSLEGRVAHCLLVSVQLSRPTVLTTAVGDEMGVVRRQ